MFKFDFFGTENSSPDLGPSNAPSASNSTGATATESVYTARRVEPSCEVGKSSFSVEHGSIACSYGVVIF